jgi:hypothetical protein
MVSDSHIALFLGATPYRYRASGGKACLRCLGFEPGHETEAAGHAQSCSGTITGAF